MQLTDWLASWWTRGKKTQRGRRRGQSRWRGSRQVAAAEALESRELLTSVAQLLALGTGVASPDQLVNVNGALFFNANDGAHGRELWKSDGTVSGTSLVKDIQVGSADGVVSGSRTSAVVGNTLFFVANDGVGGAELWKSDGTAAGTVIVVDLNAGANGSSPQWLVNVNGTLFFTADDGINGRELWKLDVGDVAPRLASNDEGSGGVSATSNDASRGATSPTLVKDIRAGLTESAPLWLTNVNGKLFFSATDGVKGRELWCSDGTAAGTVLVKDIRSGAADGAPQQLANANGVLYFSATETTNGRELWKSDGTSAGTVLVTNLNASTANSNPAEMTLVGSTVFFAANDGISGRELWQTDGTAAGTTLVKDIFAGVDHANPQSLLRFNGRLWFTATDGIRGRELWVSDGSTANTQWIQDLLAGSGSSDPRELTGFGASGLMFSADGGTGRQLWRLETAQVPTAFGVATISISAASVSQPEGNSGSTPFTFTVTRTGDVRETAQVGFVVTVSGVGTESQPTADAADFGGSLPSGTISFAANETEKTLTINVSGDAAVEADEGFTVTLSTPAGVQAGSLLYANASATGTILNDDAVLSIAELSVSKAEGNSGNTPFTFTVTRTGNTSGPASASYAVRGSGATPAATADFGGTLPSGIVNFAAGELTKTITINVSGNKAVELDDEFTITLSNPTGATVGTASAVGTILNDDTAFAIAATDANKLEGDSGNTPLTFTISREGVTNQAGSVQVRVDLSTGAGNAASTDFASVPPTTTLSFAAGETSKTFVLNTTGDQTAEPDEAFVVSLLNPVNATLKNTSATGVILNDDSPRLSIAAWNASQFEGNSGTNSFTFTVTRIGETSGTASANFRVAGSGSNPANGADFGGSFPSGTVTFEAGVSSRTITINVPGDTTVESDENFDVTLSNVVGASLGTSVATGTIRDDDGRLSIVVTDASQVEGNSGRVAFNFTVSRPAGDIPASVVFAVSGGSPIAADAADFGGTFPSGTLNFAVGETSRTLTIDVTGDATIEGDDTFVVTLSNGIGGTIKNATAAAIIRDDDDILIVDTLTDESDGNFGSGDFSLREAIEQANAKAGTQTIVFAPSLTATSAATITVTQGEMSVSDPVNILGPTDNGLTISGNRSSRIFRISSNRGPVTIIDLTLQDGKSSSKGGAIWMESEVTLIGCTLTQNEAQAGGAIGNGGELRLVQCTLSGNQAESAGGAIYNIYWAKTLVIDQSTITQNVAGYGGGVFMNGESVWRRIDGQDVLVIDHADVTLRNSLVVGNTARSSSANANIDGWPFGSPRWTEFVFSTASLIGDAEVDADLILNPILADNGGTTKTHALVAGSPAINAGDVLLLPTDSRDADGDGDRTEPLPFDQRGNGFARVIAGTVDIGAVEFPAPVPLVTVTVSPDSVTEDGSSELTFTLTRDVTTGPLTVNIGLSGTATLGTDYSASATTSVTFVDGASTATLTVDPTADTNAEADETVIVTINSGTGYQIGTTSSATGTITNDDAALSIAATDAAKPDGSGGIYTPFTFTVSRTGNADGPATATWRVSGTGTSAATESDFGSAFPSGTVSFADGETTKTITVSVWGEGAVEYDETFQVTLSNPTGADIGTASASGTIVADETLILIEGNYSGSPILTKNEGNSGTTPYNITIKRFGKITDITTVQYAFTAFGGYPTADAADFGGTLPSGTLTFAAGETSKTLILNATGDTTTESDEQFHFTLSNVVGATVNNNIARITLLNDDTSLKLSDNAPIVLEGNSGTAQVTFRVNRNGLTSGTSTVNYTVTGSGLHPADANDLEGGLSSGQLTFGPGERYKQIIVNVRGDTQVEYDESFTVTLSNPTGATLETGRTTLTAMILDEDAITSNTWVVDTLADETDGDVTAGHFSLREAILRANYVPGRQTITFAPSLTATGPATITLTQGMLYVGAQLDLVGPTDGSLTISGNDLSAILTIRQTFATVSHLTFTKAKGSQENSSAVQIIGANVTMIGCTFYDNETVWSGGAISNTGDLTLVNCTISGNRAKSGGAIHNFDKLTIQQSTITGNVGNSGTGGINNPSFYTRGGDWRFYYDVRRFGIVTLTNSIVAGNTSIQDARHNDLGGATEGITASSSLVGDYQSFSDFDIATVLDSRLSDNGGPTRTHALVAGSAAINAGAVGSLPADTLDLDGDGDRTEPTPFDQRGAGFARVIDGLPDLGAWEFGTPRATVTVSVSPRNVTEDGSENLVFTLARDFTSGPLTVDFGVSGSATNGTDYASVTAGSVTFADGVGSVSVTADPTLDSSVELDETVVLTILRGTGYGIGVSSVATGTILNDDLPPVPTTPQLIDIGAGAAGPDNLINLNGAMFFFADDGVHGRELWSSDGTAVGTVLVKDVQTGSTGSAVSGLSRSQATVGNTLFFVANDGLNGAELWKSDGTAAGTMLVSDLNPGANGSTPQQLTNVNGTLFFSADDGVNGRSLWIFDGINCRRLPPNADADATRVSFEPTDLIDVGGVLFFVAADAHNGRELWKSDGTAAGTVLVKDIHQVNNSDLQSLTNLNGRLYFSATDRVTGNELWTSNGTAAGTVLVKDIRSGNASSAPQQLVAINGELWFTANNGTTGRELWKSNGTSSGTVLIKDITRSSAHSNPADMTLVGDTIYFAANRGFDVTYGATEGRELWKTDGTVEGTVLVKDIFVGPDHSNPQNLVSLNGRLWFTATNGTNGRELWSSDGSAAGTILVSDLSPGSGNSDPSPLVVAAQSNRLFFAADDGVHGRELFSLDTAAVIVTPTISVRAVNSTRSEGSHDGHEPFAFRVTRDGDSSGAATVTFAVTGSGLNPADAADFGGEWSTGTIQFANGETTKLIEIGVASDLILEPDETFLLTLSNATGASLGMFTATGVIRNDDSTISITATNASRIEGEGSEFTLTRSGSLATEATVEFRVTGSGEHPADNDDFRDRPRGVITFAPGEASKTFAFKITNDTNVEPNEEFTVTLTNARGATIATATANGMIQNDDCNVRIQPLDAVKPEGNSGTTPFTFQVLRTGLTDQTATVTYALQTTSYNVGYFDFSQNARTGTLTFAPGETEKTITFDVVGDTKYPYGGDQAFSVSLSNITRATLGISTANGLIVNDDSAVFIYGGEYDLGTSSPKPEGNSGTTPFTVTLRRDGINTEPASIDYAVIGYYQDRADAADFGGTLPSGTISFAPGETAKTVTINVTGDLEFENDEYFRITFANPVGTTIGSSYIDGLIRNDDPRIVATTTAPILEGDAGVTAFRFQVSRPGSGNEPLQVQYAVAGSGLNGADAADFGGTLPSGTISFGEDEDVKTVTINVTGDTDIEPDETFTLTISDLAGNLLGLKTETIRNDEKMLSMTAVNAAQPEGNSGETLFNFIVSRNDPTDAVSVDFVVTPITANAADFGGTLPSGGTLQFVAGETSKTVTIRVTGDTDIEGDETFWVYLSNPVGTSIRFTTPNVVIQADDFLIVDTLADESDGDFSPGDFSLREAIERANLIPGGKAITFAPSLTASGPATITLGGTQLIVASDVTINGPGAGLLTIDADDRSRVFQIDDGQNGTIRTVAIRGLTLTGGKSLSNGGAIINQETLTIEDCVVTENVSDDKGGGFFNNFELTVVGSVISRNRAGNPGGGISNNYGSTVNVLRSWISDNWSQDQGGGIYSTGGTLNVIQSTISGNTNDRAGGGGIYARGELTITQSTISGNSTPGDGGGVWNYSYDGRPLRVSQSTISGSTARRGAGIYSHSYDEYRMVLTNSIIAGNRKLSGEVNDIEGNLPADSTSSHNLISSPTAAASLTHGVNGNIVGRDDGSGNRIVLDAGTVLDLTLANHGGPIPTLALVGGGPAFNAGDTALIPTDTIDLDGDGDFSEVLPFDERGSEFARVIGDSVDIGAFELTADSTPLPTVNVTTATKSFDEDLASSVVLTFTRNITTGPLTANFAWSGTATWGTDYSANATRSVTFTDGEATATVTIIVSPDTVLEPDESIVATVVFGDGYFLGGLSPSAAVTLVNDDTELGVSTTALKAEGNSGLTTLTFLVTRYGRSKATTVNYTVAGTGATPADANDLGGTLPNGTLNFTASQSQQSITVNVSGDTTIEPDESLTLTLSDGVGVGLRTPTATVMILDDDDVSSNVFVVDTLVDESDFDFGPGDFSLREAIAKANALPGTQTITFAPSLTASGPATILLAGMLPEVNSDLNIVGPGADRLTLNANGKSRILSVLDFQPTIHRTVNISGLTFTGAVSSAIANTENLTLTACRITGNSSRSGVGGGIENSTGTLTVLQCEISNNMALGGGGGGVFNSGGTLTVLQSTISGNFAASGGGGISNSRGALTVLQSTISGNFATSGGGGISSYESTGTLTIAQSTISGNSTTNGSAGGASVYTQNSQPGAVVTNSIIAGNTLDGIPNDLRSNRSLTADSKNNLIGTPAFAGGLIGGNNGNIVGNGSGGVLDLGTVLIPTLANNGGATKTHALVSGSRAINAGNNSLVPADVNDLDADGNTTEPLPFDQRGSGFVRVFGDTVDIGAVELAPPSVTVSVTPMSVTEDGVNPLVFTLTRGVTVGALTVNFSLTGTATTSEDFSYSADATSSVTFADGANTVTVTVDPTADSTIEADETVILTLLNGTGYQVGTTSVATGTVQNDDASLSITSNNVESREGDGGNTPFKFLVTRTGSTQGIVTVDYAVKVNPNVHNATPGNADGEDFGGTLPSGTIQFGDGESQLWLTVNVLADRTAEYDERFRVELSNISGAMLGHSIGTATITNDDTLIELRVYNPIYFYEGHSGDTQPFFTVGRFGVYSQSVSVDFAITGSGLHPADAEDFGGSFPSGTITFGPYQNRFYVPYTIHGDTTVEPNETFTITLSNPINAVLGDSTTVGTIADDDLGLSLTALDAVKPEGNSGNTPFTFRVSRGTSVGTVSGNFEVRWFGENPAMSADFGGTLPKGTFFLAEGETSTTITINVAGNKVIEADEEFAIWVSNVVGSSVVNSTALGKILNDDAAFAIAATNANRSEGNSGTTAFTFTVIRTGDLSRAATVAFLVSGSGTQPANAADFGGTFPSGTLNFAIGESLKSIVVNVNGDADIEPDETFAVTLSNAVGANIVTGSAIGVIVSEDLF